MFVTSEFRTGNTDFVVFNVKSEAKEILYVFGKY